MEICGLSPYWLDGVQSNTIRNTVKMQSLFLLTGPNGGGKSSIIRSICAAALLGICGLMVPAEKAVIPHFDSIMLHMKSYDSPADGKSSFQIEMSEIRSIVTNATPKSLVLMDEICRGTEMMKGTCIAGSIIEAFDAIGCLGVVSTHLHGIFDLPLQTKRTIHKAMGTEVIDGHTEPTWTLIDGICKESLAFETAQKEGVPEPLIRRAEKLYGSIRKRDVYSEQTNIRIEKQTPDCGVDNLYEVTNAFERIYVKPAPSWGSESNPTEIMKEVGTAVTIICQKRLIELYKKKTTAELVEVICVTIGAREQPPPSTVGASCVYVIFRPDKRLYVGQTDDLVGRVRAHRSKEGMQNIKFLYFTVQGKSIASELETLLINQLSSEGHRLVNKADGKHRNFGSSNLLLGSVTSHD